MGNEAHSDRFDPDVQLYISRSASHGQGLFARKQIEKDSLLARCPVKILDVMEYQALRFIPMISAYQIKEQGPQQDLDALLSLREGLDRLIDDPDEVLGGADTGTASHATIMYTFAWHRPKADGGDTAAIAFGLVSFCNHAPTPDKANARLERDYDNLFLELWATKSISKDEEVLIRYESVPFEPS